jgi:hypothetical protein
VAKVDQRVSGPGGAGGEQRVGGSGAIGLDADRGNGERLVGAPRACRHLTPAVIASRHHGSLAREAARQAVVLLKNDADTLPISPGTVTRLAATDPLAERGLVDWYAGEPPYHVSPLDGLRADPVATTAASTVRYGGLGTGARSCRGVSGHARNR